MKIYTKLLESTRLFSGIKGKLALYFVLLALTPILILGVMAYTSEKDALADRVRAHLTSIADMQKGRISNWLSERVSDVSFLANDAHIRKNLAALERGDYSNNPRTVDYQEVLAELGKMEASHQYLDIMLLDAEGRVVVSSFEGELGESRAYESYFMGAFRSGLGSTYIQDIYRDNHLGKIAMAFASPVESYGRKGAIGGMVVVFVGMDRSFYPMFNEWPGMGATGETLITRREGDYVVYLNRLRFDPEAPLTLRFPVSAKKPMPSYLSTGGEEGIIETNDYRGVKVLAAYRHIPETGWGFIVKQDYDDAFASVSKLGLKVGAAMAIALLMVFILIYLVSSRIAQPIVSLNELTRRVRDGDFGVSLPVRRHDEIGGLASSFNDMARSLESYRREVDEKGAALEQTNEELDLVNKNLYLLNEQLEERVAERTAALEASESELRRFAAELEESRNMVRNNLGIVERANMELRRIDQMKDHFLGMVSHELRTPLSLITAYTSSMLADPSVRLDPHIEESVEGIYKGAERLKGIITEMLDVSQIDSRGLDLEIQPANVSALISDVLREVEPFIRERGQRVVVGDFSGAPNIGIDAVKIQQVLVNIVGNAIKFTPDGGRIDIFPRVYNLGREVDGGVRESDSYLDIVVKDTGIGIDGDEITRIFEKFYEVGEIDRHTSSKYGYLGRGMGLGLPIARGIVEAHRGRLWAESEGFDPERRPGSVFHVLLPVSPEFAKRPGESASKARMKVAPARELLAPAPDGPEVKAKEDGGRPFKVLVVDDEPDILKLTARILGPVYRVEVASSGEEGLEKAVSFMPDLILLDVYMDGMNGYDTCEVLKKDWRTSHIRIAFFTAGVQKWEVDRGYRAGGDDYITKPFTPSELLAKVRGIIQPSAQAA